jgi:hypothetical protein
MRRFRLGQISCTDAGKLPLRARERNFSSSPVQICAAKNGIYA